MHSRPCHYTRCPACHLVGPPESIEAQQSAAGTINWHRPVRWRCACCGTQRPITADDVLADDAAHACPRCGQTTACPKDAVRAECGSCGAHSAGPAARIGAALGLDAAPAKGSDAPA